MRKVFFTLSFIVALANHSFAQKQEQEWVDSVYMSLTLEQKVGQLMNLRTNQPDQPYFPLIDEMIRKYNIGGVTYFRSGDSKSQMEQTMKWQSEAQTPLMITIDGEWGLGMRIKDCISYPYQMTLGALREDDLISEMGCQIAEQCRLLGIQSNFSPVVDVNSEPSNPVIGMRSFGENPEKVARKGLAYARALQDNGILPTMKHFPGHGDTHTDSHVALPVVAKSLSELEKTEIVPFKYMIDNGISGLMVGHLSYPAIDDSGTPTSLSAKTINGFLRKKLGFEGLVVTDGLDMKGLTGGNDPDKACLMALMAGADVLLLPVNPENSIKIIVEAAKSDDNVMRRVSESCRRILTWKYRLGLAEKQSYEPSEISAKMKNPRYSELKQRIYDEAVTVLSNNDFAPLNKDEIIAFISTMPDDNMFFLLKNKGFKCEKISFENCCQNLKEMVKKLKDYDRVIVNLRNTSVYASRHYGINQEMISLVNALSKNKNLVLNLFTLPYAIDMFDFAKKTTDIIVGYEDNVMVERSVTAVLCGDRVARGVLPVSTKLYKEGSGIACENDVKSIKNEGGMMDPVFERKVDSIVLEGLGQQAYPGCQVLAVKDGVVIYDKCFGTFTYEDSRAVQPDDVYDIASLTKIFGSTIAIMKLYDENKIDINAKLSDFFPFLRGTNKADITLLEIMTHQSGMQAWHPFYLETIENGKINPLIYSDCLDEDHPLCVAENVYIEKNYWREMLECFVTTEMGEKKYKYCDMGFYFMPKIVELTTGMPFEEYLDETFYRPMGLLHLFFNPLKHIEIEKIVPTSYDSVFRKQLLRGYVNDQAAAMMGGVSGHAGLFANAHDLAAIMQMLVDGGVYNGRRYLSKATVKMFTTAPFTDNDNRRGIGFDKPNIDSNSPFTTPSLRASMKSFGHTGFTGTFAWADPENNLVVVFLSNRVCPDENNNKLSKMDIRTNIHDVFYQMDEEK